MGILLEQNDGLSRFRLQGAIDIGCAAELKEVLVQELKSGSRVRVSLEETTGMDVTTVQLLLAASREAKRVGVEFALEGQAPETVRSALDKAGIGEFPVPA